jgi:hypothetical protein
MNLSFSEEETQTANEYVNKLGTSGSYLKSQLFRRQRSGRL